MWTAVSSSPSTWPPVLTPRALPGPVSPTSPRLRAARSRLTCTPTTSSTSLTSAETFEGKIEAYTYPDEWLPCDGSAVVDKVVIGQQDRSGFGLAYRTIKGNDQKKNNYGYKLHLLYGLNASPSERSYATVNDSPEAITFSWSFKGTPVNVTGHKPTCVATLDSTVVGNKGMAAIEKLIWGDSTTDSKLPTPDEVIAAVKAAV